MRWQSSLLLIFTKRRRRCSCDRASPSEVYGGGACDVGSSVPSKASHSCRNVSLSSLLLRWPRHTLCIVFAACCVSRSFWRCARSCWARSRAACDPLPEPVLPNACVLRPPRFTWRGFRVFPVKLVNMADDRGVPVRPSRCRELYEVRTAAGNWFRHVKRVARCPPGQTIDAMLSCG